MNRLLSLGLLVSLLLPAPALARYYDPGIGRFLSQDKYPGQCSDVPSLHKYTYAKLNPLRFVDPDGNAANDAYGVCPGSPGGICPRTSGAAWAGMGEGAVVTAPLVYEGYKKGVHAVSQVVESATDISTERQLAPFDSAPWAVRTAAYAGNYVAAVNAKAAGQIAVGVMGIGLLPETLYHSKAEFDSAQEQTMSGLATGNGDDAALGIGRLSGVVGSWAAIAAGGRSVEQLRTARISRSYPSVSSGELASGEVNSVTVGRSVELGAESTLAELRAGRLYPGRAGVVLTERTVAFRDLHVLSSELGVEVSLSREAVGDSSRYVLRSGSYTSVRGTPLAAGNRTLAHTHLPAVAGEQVRIDLPSRADISASDRLYDAYLAADPYAAPPMSRVLWGTGAEQQTFFGPGFR